MNRAFWNRVNRMQEGIIVGSTNLRYKVELRVGGRAVECCHAPNVQEMCSWVKFKVREWHAHTPGVKPEFVVV